MACMYSEHDSAPVVEIRVVGRVTEHDMDEILPKLEAFIRKHGKIRMIEVVERFDGFDPITILDGMKFDIKHMTDVSHVAFVSDIPWISFLTGAVAAVSPVVLRTFSENELEAARAWALEPEG